MQSPTGGRLWRPGPSLWSLIAELVPGSELPGIRSALGRSLVDTYTEAHAEAAVWHKMWQECREGGSRAATPRRGGPRLADPPAVKELVTAEVRMLLRNLREAAGRDGRHDEELLSRYKAQTVNFALGRLDNCADPPANDTESRPGSRCSVQSGAEEEIEALKDKLNITDVDEVVDRIKSVLLEECKALKTQIKHIQENISKSCRGQWELDEAEPTLAELKDLRGAIQKDLELYSSSSPSSPLPARALKTTSRASAGQTADQRISPAATTTSVLKPHPPSSPRPAPPGSLRPAGASSLLRTRDRRSGETPAAVRSRVASGRRSAHLATADAGQTSDDPSRHCSDSPKRDSPGPRCKTPTLTSSAQEACLPSAGGPHSPSGENDLSSQTERKSRPARRSENIDIVPSPTPALGPRCDGGSCECGDGCDIAGRSVLAAGEPAAQPEPRDGVRGGGSAPPDAGGFRSGTTRWAAPSTGGRPAQNDSTRSSHQTNRRRKGRLGEDLARRHSPNGRRSTDHSTRQPEGGGPGGRAACPQQQLPRLNGQFFTSGQRPLGGIARQLKGVQAAQPEQELLSPYLRPAPPARVTS